MTTGLVCNKGLINGDRAVGETRRRPPHHARPFLIRIDLKSDGLSPAPLMTLITNRETAFHKKIIFTRRTKRETYPRTIRCRLLREGLLGGGPGALFRGMFPWKRTV